MFSGCPYKKILPCVQESLEKISSESMSDPKILNSLKEHLTIYIERSKNELGSVDKAVVKKINNRINTLSQELLQGKESIHKQENEKVLSEVELSNKMVRLSLKKTRSCLPKKFRFKEGDKADSTLRFAHHAARWYDSSDDPFQNDPIYQCQQLSQEEKEDIRLRHTTPLSLVGVIVEYGDRYQQRGGLCESFRLPADIQWKDGSGQAHGVIAIGRECATKTIFHDHFSRPKDVEAYYNQNDFVRSPWTGAEPPARKQSQGDRVKDGSVISEITADEHETRVTAISPHNNDVQMTVHILKKQVVG